MIIQASQTLLKDRKIFLRSEPEITYSKPLCTAARNRTGNYFYIA